LHHEVRGAVVLTEVVHGPDVGVREAAHVACLAADRLGDSAVVCCIRPQHLHRNVSAQGHVHGTPDVTHPTRGDALGEAIAAGEDSPLVEGHRPSTPPITALAIGAAPRPPTASLPTLPPSSTTTATATLELTAG